jgi:hypothetical protein
VQQKFVIAFFGMLGSFVGFLIDRGFRKAVFLQVKVVQMRGNNLRFARFGGSATPRSYHHFCLASSDAAKKLNSSFFPSDP